MSRRTMACSSSNMNSARARASSVFPQLVDPARRLLDLLERLFLLRPARRERVALLLRLGERALDGLTHLLRLLRHRRELDLELHHAAVRLVELDRRGVDLHAQA